MANYPQELAQDAVCQSDTGHMTGLWFLPARPLRLNTNEWMKKVTNICNLWKKFWADEVQYLDRSKKLNTLVGLYGGHSKKIRLSDTSMTPSGYFASSHNKYIVLASGRENWFRSSY